MIRRLAALGAAAALLGAAAAPAGARDYVGLVNPWIEADRGRFFFFQSAATPFGFAKLRPDTSTGSTQGSGYPSTLNEVKGFSHVHEWRLSGIQVMPTSGSPVVKTRGDSEWQSPVDHGDEVAEPGYHRVHLDRYGIGAELTATDRVGLHRYTYDKAGPGEIVVNLGGVLGQATMKDAHVERVGRRQLVGWVRQSSTGFASHDTKLYFDLRVDRPFTALDGWVERQARERRRRAGRRADGRLPALRPALVVTDEGRAVADGDRRRVAQSRGRRSRLGLRPRAAGGAGALERAAGAHRRARDARPGGEVLHRPLPRAVRARRGLRRRRRLPRRHLERGRRAPRRADVQLRRAVADAVERQHGPRARLPRDLRRLRGLSAADVPRRRAAPARAGGRQLLDGDDQLAGDVVHHGRDQQGDRGRRGARLRGDDGCPRGRRAVRQAGLRVRRVELARRCARLPDARLRAVRPGDGAAGRWRGDDARVREPGLRAGAARAAAGQARDQRRAVRGCECFLGRGGAGDRRAAGAVGRRALGRRRRCAAGLGHATAREKDRAHATRGRCASATGHRWRRRAR